MRLKDLGGFASQPRHQSQGTYRSGGATSSDRTSLSGHSQEFQSSDLSNMSFLQSVSIAPAYQHAVTPIGLWPPSSIELLGVEGMYGSTDTSHLTSNLPETILSSATLLSSTDRSSFWGHVDDDAPSIDDLNTHRHNLGLLEQVESSTGILANLDIDSASLYMDTIGTGEQFTGMIKVS